MNYATLYGLLASALLIGALATWAPRRRRLLALAAGGLALLPLAAGESLAMWLHGAAGAPSLTLAALALRRFAFLAEKPLLTRPAAFLILACGLVFYPLALGLGPYDPYALGYQPQLLLLALLLFAAWLARLRQDAWLLILGLGLAAYAAGLFGNLWDALLDPLLVGAAAMALLRSRRRSR